MAAKLCRGIRQLLKNSGKLSSSLSRPLLSVLSRADILGGRFNDSIDVIRVRLGMRVLKSSNISGCGVRKDTCVSQVLLYVCVSISALYTASSALIF